MDGLLGEPSRVKLAFLNKHQVFNTSFRGDDLQLDKDFSWGQDHYLGVQDHLEKSPKLEYFPLYQGITVFYLKKS